MDLGDDVKDMDEQITEPNNERRWRLSYLKDQFEILDLHKLFHRYTQRISHGYFSQFLSLQVILISSHFVTLLAVPQPSASEVIPDLTIYGFILLLSVALLVVTDKYVKANPVLLKYLAAIAFVTTFFMNFFIPYYYRSRPSFGNLRPAYTAYLIISNYIFLNIHSVILALSLGIFVSLCHIATLVLVTYENFDRLAARLASDCIYLFCINLLGIYFRYMNEIVIRRSFLDRRSSIESTHRLRFEQEQQNHLMSSIIPPHIIEKVRKTLTDYFITDPETQEKTDNNPFGELYVEEYRNVSILFADIVNYTMMTTQLNVVDLLDILNELFVQFDDASEKLKVMRIKFLGDCYYCVAGLPPVPAENHAEACVDLGLKMINIIAEIRAKRDNLDINMRIGVHSGQTSCGIIGLIKWQYDIWSSDVDLANKMETEGTPGMVHITKQTKDLLKKPYNISMSKKLVNNERTYLIAPDTNSEPVSSNGVQKSSKAQSEESETNNGPRRSIFIKRTSTAPKDLSNLANSQNSTRSYSLISSYNARRRSEESDLDEESGTGKRHTFPNSLDQKIGGNRRLSIVERKASVNARISRERRLTGGDRKRRTAFMNNNIKRYTERLVETNKELEQTIENMLLSKFEQWFKIDNMYRILLVFKNPANEWEFINMPDHLFKFYLLCGLLLLSFVFILQNLTLATWDWPSWPFYLTLGISVLVFLPLSWTHFIWTKYMSKYESDTPRSSFVQIMFTASKLIINNVWIRLLIYTIMCGLFTLCVLMEWIDCYETSGGSSRVDETMRNFLLVVTNNLESSSDSSRGTCTIAWHMTETCSLAIIMSFLFLRMYMWLKLLYAFLIALGYSVCIFKFNGDFYGDSQSFNYLLQPQISHIISVLFLTIILHLVDRQTEYMNRLDHLWFQSLVQKKKQANLLHEVNTQLLKHILPLHVAELYLNVNRQSTKEVFNESYDDVAVMFASLTNFSIEDMGPRFLNIMSNIIQEFDMLLKEEIQYGRQIEKIKIAKWTYMAACGLEPGLGHMENMRKDSQHHAVISLLKFAVNMLQCLESINRDQLGIKLRIGISHGSVAAGVVGSKKPFYDIWGDPVNMASRMDTTGVDNKIQVLEETAEIIQDFGYVCHYRDEIQVKGRPFAVPTYFVALDEKFNLIARDRSCDDGFKLSSSDRIIDDE